jgi:hypothetical protein
VTGERRGFGYSSENARECPIPRWNATKHACTSSRLLLPDENPAKLDELLEALREQYRPETTLDLQFVVEAARAIWVLGRNNRRYDEIEQTLYGEEPDSTKWTEEQWRRLDLRARYRTTAERSCTRALRNLGHIRSGRAQFQEVKGEGKGREAESGGGKAAGIAEGRAAAAVPANCRDGG